MSRMVPMKQSGTCEDCFFASLNNRFLGSRCDANTCVMRYGGSVTLSFMLGVAVNHAKVAV
jgi:hypothetical protein